ncbi:MAG: hypothetical protein GX851_05435 [Clostridiales bacterium]|nr:hypothetical protein [Clostridiales bacterium]
MSERLLLDLKLVNAAASALRMFAVMKKVILFFIAAFIVLEGMRIARERKALTG